MPTPCTIYQHFIKGTPVHINPLSICWTLHHFKPRRQTKGQFSICHIPIMWSCYVKSWIKNLDCSSKGVCVQILWQFIFDTTSTKLELLHTKRNGPKMDYLSILGSLWRIHILQCNTFLLLIAMLQNQEAAFRISECPSIIGPTEKLVPICSMSET